MRRSCGRPVQLEGPCSDDPEIAGRDGEIRTPDPLNPIQVRYQTAPRPGRRKTLSIPALGESRHGIDGIRPARDSAGRAISLSAVLVAAVGMTVILRLRIGGGEILVQKFHQVLEFIPDLG